MTNLTELLKNATREQLIAVLTQISHEVERFETVEYLDNCPEVILYNGNYDDAYRSGRDDGSAFMANTIEGLIRNALDSK